MKAVWRRLKIFSAGFLVVTLAGTLGFMIIEGRSFFDALYYNIVTMSSVGYGDIYPTTFAGRLLAVFIIVLGGSLFLALIASATELFLIRREALNRRRKVNMVLGVFFSEVGYTLLRRFQGRDLRGEEWSRHLRVRFDWTKADFIAAEKFLQSQPVRVDMERFELNAVNLFLQEKRSFLIGLLENPVLIEQDGFSEALLAVFHLADELYCRDDLVDLPEADRRHLAGDIHRAFDLLTEQWLVYLRHLKDQYPYLFSLALRKNPFDPDADPVIQS